MNNTERWDRFLTAPIDEAGYINMNGQAVDDWEELIGERHPESFDIYTGHYPVGDPRRDPRDDAINSPTHYTVGGFEAIDVIESKLTPEEFRGYLKGNMLKYLMRANYKNDHDKDCEKASWYGNRLCASLNGVKE